MIATNFMFINVGQHTSVENLNIFRYKGIFYVFLAHFRSKNLWSIFDSSKISVNGKNKFNTWKILARTLTTTSADSYWLFDNIVDFHDALLKSLCDM